MESWDACAVRWSVERTIGRALEGSSSASPLAPCDLASKGAGEAICTLLCVAFPALGHLTSSIVRRPRRGSTAELLWDALVLRSATPATWIAPSSHAGTFDMISRERRRCASGTLVPAPPDPAAAATSGRSLAGRLMISDAWDVVSLTSSIDVTKARHFHPKAATHSNATCLPRSHTMAAAAVKPSPLRGV